MMLILLLMCNNKEMEVTCLPLMIKRQRASLHQRKAIYPRRLTGSSTVRIWYIWSVQTAAHTSRKCCKGLCGLQIFFLQSLCRSVQPYQPLKALYTTSHHSPIHIHVHTLVAQTNIQESHLLIERCKHPHIHSHTENYAYRELFGVQYLAQRLAGCRGQ